jgi:hypothetical protein
VALGGKCVLGASSCKIETARSAAAAPRELRPLEELIGRAVDKALKESANKLVHAPETTATTCSSARTTGGAPRGHQPELDQTGGKDDTWDIPEDLANEVNMVQSKQAVWHHGFQPSVELQADEGLRAEFES